MMTAYLVTLSALTAVVLLVRALLRGKLPARVTYALWLAVVLRMCLPVFLFEIPLPVKETPVRPAEETHLIAETAGEAVLPVTADVSVSPVLPAEEIETTQPSAVSDPPAVPQTRKHLDFPSFLKTVPWKTVWFAGSAALGAWFLTSGLFFQVRLFRNRKRLGMLKNIRIYASPAVGSGCVYGLVPAIYLSPAIGASDRRFLAVLHEYTHLLHGDVFWNLLRCAALAVFWWNPLVWAAAFLSKNDSEFACDEAVAARLGEKTRLAYARLLLDAAPKKRTPVPAFSGSPVAERIRRLTVKPKSSMIAVVLAVLLSLGAVGCSFCEAVPGKTEPADTRNETQAELLSIDDLRSMTGEEIRIAYCRGEVSAKELFLASDTAYIEEQLQALYRAYNGEPSDPSFLRYSNFEPAPDGTVFDVPFTLDNGEITAYDTRTGYPVELQYRVGDYELLIGFSPLDLFFETPEDMAHIEWHPFYAYFLPVSDEVSAPYARFGDIRVYLTEHSDSKSMLKAVDRSTGYHVFCEHLLNVDPFSLVIRHNGTDLVAVQYGSTADTMICVLDLSGKLYLNDGMIDMTPYLYYHPDDTLTKEISWLDARTLEAETMNHSVFRFTMNSYQSRQVNDDGTMEFITLPVPVTFVSDGISAQETEKPLPDTEETAPDTKEPTPDTENAGLPNPGEIRILSNDAGYTVNSLVLPLDEGHRAVSYRYNERYVLYFTFYIAEVQSERLYRDVRLLILDTEQGEFTESFLLADAKEMMYQISGAPDGCMVCCWYYDDIAPAYVAYKGYSLTERDGHFTVTELSYQNVFPQMSVPVYSPSGSRMAYKTETDGWGTGALYLREADGTETKILDQINYSDENRIGIEACRVYTPVCFTDETHLIFHISGWEWTVGRGVYDTETGEITIYEDGIGLRMCGDTPVGAKMIDYEITEYYLLDDFSKPAYFKTVTDTAGDAAEPKTLIGDVLVSDSYMEEENASVYYIRDFLNDTAETAELLRVFPDRYNRNDYPFYKSGKTITFVTITEKAQ